MKVALVHDWFVGGGAEKVVYELHQMFPKAPIYTAYCNPAWRKKLEKATIITSYMQHWPFPKLRKFLPPLRALWFSRLNFEDFDLVISSSGAEAKGIRVNKPTIHINYCHAPTHYYWSRHDEYLKQPGFGRLDPLARLGLKLLVAPMRRLDYSAAQEADYFIANSSYTKEQVKKYYNRDSVVIHPPVDIERFRQKTMGNEQRRGFVTAGRQVPYKKIDLAVKAATKLNMPLVVIGRGPDHAKLKRLAGRSVTFLTNVTDEEMPEKFAQAEAFIFPGIDDFGIVAVEALAAGTPVISYKDGGALDYVNKDTGILFGEQTVESLTQALEEFKKKKLDNGAISKQAEQFSAANFRASVQQFLKSLPKNG